ncbi:MAG: glycine cleavage system protein GcvH [Candidatus Bathyarchaeia archaeon]
MKVDDYEVLEGLYYTKEHEWVKIEGNNCRIGITDYAQKSLHEIVFVDLPKVGAKVSQMQSIGAVESVKAVADIFSPISGEVVEVNDRLLDSPELLNKSSYSEGWIALIAPSNLDEEIKKLLDTKSYCDYIKSLLEKK